MLEAHHQETKSCNNVKVYSTHTHMHANTKTQQCMRSKSHNWPSRMEAWWVGNKTCIHSQKLLHMYARRTVSGHHWVVHLMVTLCVCLIWLDDKVDTAVCFIWLHPSCVLFDWKTSFWWQTPTLLTCRADWYRLKERLGLFDEYLAVWIKCTRNQELWDSTRFYLRQKKFPSPPDPKEYHPKKTFIH